MTDDAADAEQQEERRAAEERLIAERNAAHEQADQPEGEQPLILTGEDDAAAVTGLHADVDKAVALGGDDD